MLEGSGVSKMLNIAGFVGALLITWLLTYLFDWLLRRSRPSLACLSLLSCRLHFAQLQAATALLTSAHRFSPLPS